MSKLRIEWLEEEYQEILKKNCKCNVQEDGCDCQSFEDWYEDLISSEAYYDEPEERLA